MKRGGSTFLGLLLLLGLLSCAGAPEARVPADSSTGGESSKAEAASPEPAEAPAPADFGDAEVGDGELRGTEGEPERPDWVVVEKASEPAAAKPSARASRSSAEASGPQGGLR